ncbi:iron-hydroxamate ABC transporter substrate-binding protein [Mesobacillus maritimus]|uniref:Iron-hydroxamate ABC transporter substrate-binding protein n=1 Tax=Mesobacillus maritimus TaxID=1643336 RepID=A0ABS7K780_9BACI|nr:iron-hydroxamate ABC transporter substrate-binding protein [Mesobacillus maritimus]MBY0098080.1 iron-hydroxamate ABC transporter substrate-binding protein [Mesobacillus maritimus]
MKKNMKFRRLFFTIVMSLLVLIISACGNDDASPEPESEGGTESSDVTLDSGMGEVTLPGNAEKIMAPFHEDALLALGVTPVAKWAIGQSVQDYLEKDLKDVPSIEWNLPLEQVLSHEPDLIILQNNMDSYEGSFDDYNKIAPTYVMKEETVGDWRKQIETFGTILGKEDAAKKAISDYEEKVADAKEQIAEGLGDETAAVIWAVGNQFFLFEQNRHSAEVLYSELGVKQPKLIEELGEADAAAWNPISVEKLSELDADHVILLALEGEQGIETLEKSSVWQSTPAAKKANVHLINDPSNWTNKGLIASQETIDDVLSALVK